MARTEFNFGDLATIVEDVAVIAKNKVAEIGAKKSAVSIGDMFDVQMTMNRLSQLSEMSTNVMSAANQSTLSMARNIK